MILPAECRFGTHMGGLAEEEGHLSFLELNEEKSPLKKKRGKGKREEGEENDSVHLTCSALWEEQ